MPLPKIDLPISILTLPSTGDKIKYRPFTVKEEKILLVAQESDDAEQEILAARQVVNNCLIDVDVSTLAMFDLEYVLLILRSRSVDNTTSFSITDPDTGEVVELTVDIEQIQLLRNPEHTNQVKINEQYTLILKYPTIDEFAQIITLDFDDPLSNYFIMVSCLESIVSDDELHNFADYNREEIDLFMSDMTGDTIKGIQKFFKTIPVLRHEMKYTNKEGTEKTFVIEGIRSFFI
jgi:hypothetical protein